MKTKLGVFAAIAAVFLVWKYDPLAVRVVEIDAAEASCVDVAQLETALTVKGKNILLVGASDLEKTLAAFPCIHSFSLKKTFDRKMLITLKGRRLLARVALMPKSEELNLDDLEATPSSQSALVDWSFPDPAASQSYFMADNEGVVFGVVSATDSAVVYLPEQSLSLGSKLDRQVFGAIDQILAKLYQLQLIAPNRQVQAKLADGQLVMRSDNTGLIFSLNKDIVRQLASLQLILQKAKIDGKVLETVDLRFDKPVVIYGKG